jgi:hypothetical protein
VTSGSLDGVDHHLLSQQQNVLGGLRETLEERVAVTESVRRLDERIASLVLAAREYGASWSAIAGVLGTSKQAAWERYGQRERRQEA